MSLKQYQEYKSTGVDFYKVAPNHWKVERLSAVAEFQSGKAHEPFITEDGEFICVNSRFVSTRGESVKFCSENLTSTKINDVLMVMSDLPNGRALAKGFYVDNEAPYAVNQRVCRIRAINVEPKFLYYYMDRSPLLLRNDDGLNQTHLSNSDFKNCPIFIPSLEEQKSIVCFLEYETTKIDELVAEQQNLIELLKEKRQTVISQTVTKGLDPQVGTKDSGNLWLKQVPDNWRVGRLKHIKSPQKNAFVDGPFGSNLKSEHFIENGDVYVIESNFATQGILEQEKLKTISLKHFETINRSEVRAGDIVIAKIGAQYGKSSILPDIDKRAVVSGNSLKLTVNSNIVDVKFVNWFIVNLKSLGVIEDIVNATAQPALSLGELNNLPMLIPPLEEQKLIVKYLEEVLNQFEALISQANVSIDLLKERRSALISGAVTGQIDVRNYQSKGVA
jgi:type I restriction enzyme S subunit